MRRSIYSRRRKYFGKGSNLIRPTLNSGRIFVGEGLRKKKRKHRKKKVIYGKGALSKGLLATSIIASLFGK